MTRWKSPYGPGRCLVCPAWAAVVTRDADGDQADLCGQHWQLVRRSTGGLVRAVRLVRHRRRTDG
jgi:hypothetical protein